MTEPAAELAAVHTAITELAAIVAGARAALGGGAGPAAGNQLEMAEMDLLSARSAIENACWEIDFEPPAVGAVSRSVLRLARPAGVLGGAEQAVPRRSRRPGRRAPGQGQCELFSLPGQRRRAATRAWNANGGCRHVVVYAGCFTTVICGDASGPAMSHDRLFVCQRYEGEFARPPRGDFRGGRQPGLDLVHLGAVGEPVRGLGAQFIDALTYGTVLDLEDQVVPADLVRAALLGRPYERAVLIPFDGIDPHGLQLVNARILGVLDLRSVRTAIRIQLSNCVLLDDGLDVSNARLDGGLDLSGSVISQMTATRAVIRGVNFSGTEFSSTYSTYTSFFGDGLQIDGDMFLGGGCTSTGAIRLRGAHITGLLDLDGAGLTGTDTGGVSLDGDGLQVDGSMFLGGGCTSAGAIRLRGGAHHRIARPGRRRASSRKPERTKPASPPPGSCVYRPPSGEAADRADHRSR